VFATDEETREEEKKEFAYVAEEAANLAKDKFAVKLNPFGKGGDFKVGAQKENWYDPSHGGQRRTRRRTRSRRSSMTRSRGRKTLAKTSKRSR
jgi:hypothetical protein